MTRDIAPSDYNERVRLARLAAVDGLGWNDIVVRYSIPEDVARMLVWSTAARQKAMKGQQ